MSNIIIKTQEFYKLCEVDPHQNCLIPTFIPKFNVYHALVLGNLLNRIATTGENNWLEFNKETFYIQKQDKEGWTTLKSSVYKLVKKGFIESKSENSKTFLRLIDREELFDREHYRRRTIEEIETMA